MTLYNWLRSPRAIRGYSAARKSGHTRKTAPTRKLVLECLEERTLLSPYLVTTTADSGFGSLRDAINSINADSSFVFASPSNPNVDEIDFNITAASDTAGGGTGFNATTGVATIKPLSALPVVTHAVIINGYSQSGASPNTLLGPPPLGSTDSTLHPEKYGDNAVLKIELDGETLTSPTTGLIMQNGNQTVEGLVINRFPGIGIQVGYDVAISNVTIQGNFIGTDVTATQALGNMRANVYVEGLADQVLIGGTATAARNIISGALPASDDPNSGVGIEMGGTPGTTRTVEGNFIGTDATGRVALGNAAAGVNEEFGYGNMIGGYMAGAGNLISGNRGAGISAIRDGATVIEGNFVGTDVTGRSGLGNGINNNGIGINDGENGSVIGGTMPGSGNLISGNQAAMWLSDGIIVEGNLVGTDISGTSSSLRNGIRIFGTGNVIGGTTGARNVIASTLLIQGPGNTVQGNYIGTDLSGTIGLLDSGVGIEVQSGSNTIGGTAPGSGNLISGNGYIGVWMDGTAATGNVVQGNLIGLNAAGTSPLGNGYSGNLNNVGSGGIVLTNGASGNSIGGTASGAGNAIAYNSGPGVLVRSGTTGVSVLSNSIHDNTGTGIALSGSANDSQAAPVLTGVSGSASSQGIVGSLSSTANTTFRIEIFASLLPGNLANTEGQTLLGSIYVTTDATGKASFNATGLAAIPPSENYLTATATVATATTSGYTYGDSSQFSPYLHVAYFFGGFQAPLNQGMNFALNRVIPIKFTLTDLTGAAVASLAAVSSIQIAPVNSDGSLGTPFAPASPGNTALSVNGGTYAFNWQTKGLAAGSYAILLTLADGQVETRVVQLTKGGSSAGLTTVAAGGTGSAPGGLLGGNIELYVDNTNGDLTADELARIQDAVTAVDGVTEPYGVAVAEVTDPTLADVTLNMDTTSAVGGYADGVLGCTTDAGQITLIQGWNFYAGSDGTQIGTGQYDFETVVTHELGHALGLGHSADSTSVMYATLDTGAVNRTLTTADLNVPDTGTTGACGLHAAVVDVGRISNPSFTDVGRIENPSHHAGRDLLFALVATPLDALPLGSQQQPGRSGEPSRTIDAAFADGLAGDPILAARISSSIFARQSSGQSADPLFDVPLFPEPSLDGQVEATNADSLGFVAADGLADFGTPAPDSLEQEYE